MTLEGKRVRNFSVVDRLGEGGMGEVYLGFDEVLERQVAIKAIRPDRRLDKKAKARFLREARLLSQIEHPNICRIYEFMEEDEADLIVLELVRGTNLKERLDGVLNEPERWAIATQIVGALEAAHALGVVHRDLKPDNIMITGDGEVKVLDFGLARSFSSDAVPGLDSQGTHKFARFGDDDRASLTAETELGHILGTPRYMSPEQARGDAVTAASDMYSLGLVLQELFSTQPPYPKGLDSKALHTKALWADTEPVQGADPHLADLIEKLKSFSPAERPTAAATAERLRWLNDKPIRRRRRLAAGAAVAALAVATTISTIGFVQARRAQARAETAQAQSEAVNRFLESMLTSADPLKKGIEVKVVDVLDEAVSGIDEAFGEQPLERAAIQHTLGIAYRALGEYEPAYELLSDAFEARQTGLGAEHPETLVTKVALGKNLMDKGEFAASATMLAEALAVQGRVLGNEHPDTLATMFILAWTFKSEGKLDEAEELLRAVVSRRTMLFGEEHLETLAAKDSLGVVLRRQGRYDDARALHEEVLDAKIRLLGQRHPQLTNTLANLAGAASQQQSFEDAEIFGRQALEIRRQVYGDEHPETLKALGTLSYIVSRQRGRFEEAEELFVELQELMTRVFGADHPETLRTVHNLSTLYRRNAQPATAEQLIRQTLETLRRTVGNDNPQTANVISNLAKALVDQGRLEEAVTANREAITIRQKTLGPDHPFTLLSMGNLAWVLGRLENWQEEEEIARLAIEGWQRTDAGVVGDREFVNHCLAQALHGLGRSDEAEALLREQIEVRTENLGSSHRYTLEAMEMLANILRETGRTEEADALDEQRLAAKAKSH